MRNNEKRLYEGLLVTQVYDDGKKLSPQTIVSALGHNNAVIVYDGSSDFKPVQIYTSRPYVDMIQQRLAKKIKTGGCDMVVSFPLQNTLVPGFILFNQDDPQKIKRAIENA